MFFLSKGVEEHRYLFYGHFVLAVSEYCVTELLSYCDVIKALEAKRRLTGDYLGPAPSIEMEM